ncbi:MAG TPA: Lsr2 family protein [Acidimicrobiales bacterium]|jgi:hypothetical protein
MAKTVFVKLTDDLDGSEADETVSFGLDGRSYEIDLATANAEKLRKALEPYIAKAARAGRAARAASRPEGGRVTAFSQLSEDEKLRFRKWAKAPTARRIADAKVEEWEAAGKP